MQAAGRVLRTPDNSGSFWLLDECYGRAKVLRLLPPAWGLRPAADTQAASDEYRSFSCSGPNSRIMEVGARPDHCGHAAETT